MFSSFCLSEIYTLIEKNLDCSPFYKALAVIFLNLFLSFSLFFLPNRRSSRSFEEPSFFMSKIHMSTSILELSQTRKSFYQNFMFAFLCSFLVTLNDLNSPRSCYLHTLTTVHEDCSLSIFSQYSLYPQNPEALVYIAASIPLAAGA